MYWPSDIKPLLSSCTEHRTRACVIDAMRIAYGFCREHDQMSLRSMRLSIVVVQRKLDFPLRKRKLEFPHESIVNVERSHRFKEFTSMHAYTSYFTRIYS